MRIELAGSLVRPEPVLLTLITNQYFYPQDYIDLGYTHFDVICIGGGGGRGGGIDTANTGTLIRSYGGAGGGGGYHRVRGLLSALPTDVFVSVGIAGIQGNSHASDPNLTSDGSDGGISAFNTNTCRASGGKGGKRVKSNSTTITTEAHGGEGGSGNRTVAGGGAPGGVAGTPSATGPGTPGTAGTDGTIANNLGKGGGGGAGGVGKYGGVTCNASTPGGRGSYNPGDTSVYGPGDPPSNDSASGAAAIIPGDASGAKASPLNGLPTIYGRSSSKGVVIIRLTAE